MSLTAFHKAGDADTICALSTAPGVGGIAVIRVSGPQSRQIVRKSCRFLPETPESHRMYFGLFRELESNEPIDEVVLSYFAEGRSFTGEETVEISCHGSQVLTSRILKELLAGGARLANRGEFTYRAFMNGRLDLVQAEAVLSLIESQNTQSSKLALRQLQGRLSEEFQKIESELLWILAHLEASIDFSTEGLETVPPKVLAERTRSLLFEVRKQIGSYKKGRVLREGLQVAIVGPPNAGKSSFLNALLKEERAIVSKHAGTTRDLVEGQLSFDGLPVTFVDTAGLRETENEVEKIGIERSRSAMARADLVFYVYDLTDPDLYFDEAVPNDTSSILLNKTDLDKDGEFKKSALKSLSQRGWTSRVFFVSATTGEGLEAVEESVGDRVRQLGADSSSAVTQARHLELLEVIAACLEKAAGLMVEDSSPEFIAFELQAAIRSVHELLGQEFNEQIIDRIFKEFCLGK